MAASEGLCHGFFTGKFPDSRKLYQQLELEYLVKEADQTCMSFL